MLTSIRSAPLGYVNDPNLSEVLVEYKLASYRFKMMNTCHPTVSVTGRVEEGSSHRSPCAGDCLIRITRLSCIFNANVLLHHRAPICPTHGVRRLQFEEGEVPLTLHTLTYRPVLCGDRNQRERIATYSHLCPRGLFRC